MQEEEISSVPSLCGDIGCPLLGQSKELSEPLQFSQATATFNPTFTFASNFLRFLVYLSVPIFLVTIFICVIIICIKLIRKSKDLKPYLLIILVCVVGFVLSILEVTFVTFISALQENTLVTL
jgi:hypothetical protein